MRLWNSIIPKLRNVRFNTTATRRYGRGLVTVKTVESYLFQTCTDLGAAGYDTTYGRGIVNADAAVAKTGN